MSRQKIQTDTGYMLRETYKGLPEAGKKVGGVIGKGVGMAMQAPVKMAKAMKKALKGQPPKPLSPEEMKRRMENMERMKKSAQEYMSSHPGFKMPREFQDLMK